MRGPDNKLENDIYDNRKSKADNNQKPGTFDGLIMITGSNCIDDSKDQRNKRAERHIDV